MGNSSVSQLVTGSQRANGNRSAMRPPGACQGWGLGDAGVGRGHRHPLQLICERARYSESLASVPGVPGGSGSS